MRQSLESLYDSGGEGGGYYDYYAQPTYTPAAAPAPAYAASPAPAPAPATAQAFTPGKINIRDIGNYGDFQGTAIYNSRDWQNFYNPYDGNDSGSNWGGFSSLMPAEVARTLGWAPISAPIPGSFRLTESEEAARWAEAQGYGLGFIQKKGSTPQGGNGDYRAIIDRDGNILGMSGYNSYDESWANILAPLMMAGAAPLAGLFAGGAAPGVLANAAAGATINAGVTALDGGSLSDILKAGATGGITAGAGSALKDFVSGGDINWGMTGSSTPVYDPVADYLNTGGVEGSLLSGLDGAGGIFYNPNVKQLDSSPLQESIYDMKPLEPLEPINAQPMPDIPKLSELYPGNPWFDGTLNVGNWNVDVPSADSLAADTARWQAEQAAQQQALYAQQQAEIAAENQRLAARLEAENQAARDAAGAYQREQDRLLQEQAARAEERRLQQERLAAGDLSQETEFDRLVREQRERELGMRSPSIKTLQPSPLQESVYDIKTLEPLAPLNLELSPFLDRIGQFNLNQEQVIKTLQPSPLQESVYDIKPLEPLAPLALGASAGVLPDLLTSGTGAGSVPGAMEILKGVGTVGGAVGTIDKLLGGGSRGGGGTVGTRPPGTGTGTGAGGGTALGGLINALLGDGTNTNSGLLGMYLGGKLADKSNSEINTQLDVLKNMYGQDSPYAQQMRQVLERKDAAAGRNSQYGPREVELQARLAEATTRNAPMIKSLYDQKQANRNLAASTLSNNPLVGNVLKSLSDSGNGSILEGIKRLFNSGPDGAEQAQRLVDSGIFNQLSSTPYTGLDTGNLNTSTPSTSIGDYLSNTNSPYTSPTGTLPSYLGDQSTDWFTGYGGAPTSGGYDIDPNWWQTPSVYDWGTSSGAYTGIDPNSLPSVFWNDPMMYNNERVGEQDSDWWKNLFGNEEP